MGDVPLPGLVRINGISYGGTGCPNGSVATLLSPDNGALTVLFDQYVVDTANAPSGTDRKSCTVKLDLDGPVGWEYSLFQLDYRGYADLQAGTSGSQLSRYAFGSGQKTDLGAYSVQGPFSDDYVHSVQIPLNSAGWSRCGNPKLPLLSIETQVQVQSRPLAKEIQLASSQARKSEVDLGVRLSDITLVKKDSASPCLKNLSFGVSGTKAWVNLGCRGTFSVEFVPSNGANRPQGTMTVDSLDGYVNQQYGIAWRRCLDGQWVQTDGRLCADVCRAKGMVAGKDAAGASCVSGEARPASAAGLIQFTKGCWGGCQAEGNIQTDTLGPFCYKPGQKKDADKTDLAVGCFCK